MDALKQTSDFAKMPGIARRANALRFHPRESEGPLREIRRCFERVHPRALVA